MIITNAGTIANTINVINNLLAHIAPCPPQVQLWPPQLKDFNSGHLEYFFNSKDGILDSTGAKKPEAKVTLTK